MQEFTRVKNIAHGSGFTDESPYSNNMIAIVGNCRLLCARHEIVVEESLPLGQPAHDDVLVLPRQLLLHLRFQPPEQERPQDLMEPLDQAIVVFVAAFNHVGHGIGEPFFELLVG